VSDCARTHLSRYHGPRWFEWSALPESSRRAVREEVRARLAEFESGGRLVMTVEMLIAAGCA